MEMSWVIHVSHGICVAHRNLNETRVKPALIYIFTSNSSEMILWKEGLFVYINNRTDYLMHFRYFWNSIGLSVEPDDMMWYDIKLRASNIPFRRQHCTFKVLNLKIMFLHQICEQSIIPTSSLLPHIKLNEYSGAFALVQQICFTFACCRSSV